MVQRQVPEPVIGCAAIKDIPNTLLSMRRTASASFSGVVWYNVNGVPLKKRSTSAFRLYRVH